MILLQQIKTCFASFPFLSRQPPRSRCKRGLWLVCSRKKRHNAGSISRSALRLSVWLFLLFQLGYHFFHVVGHNILSAYTEPDTHQVSLALNLNLDHIIFCIDQCFAFTFRAEQRKRPEFRLPKQLQTCFCPTHRTSDPKSFPPCIFCHFTSILSASIRLIKRSICSLSNPETALFSSVPS